MDNPLGRHGVLSFDDVPKNELFPRCAFPEFCLNSSSICLSSVVFCISPSLMIVFESIENISVQDIEFLMHSGDLFSFIYLVSGKGFCFSFHRCPSLSPPSFAGPCI